MRPLALAFLLGIAAAPVAAQDAPSGQFLFFTFCATCHGAEGKGDGPMRAVLTIAPPDLTGLAASNDGTLPVARIVAQIEGQDPLAAHGGPMPVYGPIFEGAEPAMAQTDLGEVATTAVVLDLIAYLDTIQEQ